MSIFYDHLRACICKDIRLSLHLGCSYLNVCALFLAELEATAFLIFY